MNWIWIAIGGALGATGRMAVSRAFPPTSLTVFPWATFCVNLAGCLLIGLFWQMASRGNSWLMPLLVTGFLGGFTTFSSFGMETFQLIKNNQPVLAFTYALTSTIIGLICVMIGYWTAKFMVQAS